MRSMGHNKQKTKRKEKETKEKKIIKKKKNKKENKEGLGMAYILRWDWRSFLKV